MMRIHTELLNESFRLLSDDLDFMICRLLIIEKRSV
jgi:hypothetical protein